MRKVVLKLTTQKDLIKHESAAMTFGELKKELRQVKWSGMRVVERASKATLQMEDAVLPQGDFVLFLVPEKVKSGKKTSGGTEELSKPIEECSYNECRSHMSWLNRNKDASLDMSGGTTELQKELKKYYKKNPAGTSTGAEKPAAAAKKPAAKAPKAAKVEEYKASKRQDDEDDEDYEDRIAFEKKTFEKKAKKAAQKAEEERLAKEKEEKEAAEKKAAAKKPSAENSKKVEKAKKKGLFSRKEKAPPAPTDPIEIIEESRNRINKAVDQLVLDMIENGGEVPAVLQFTEDDLEKEIKKIHRALKTSRSNAKYID